MVLTMHAMLSAECQLLGMSRSQDLVPQCGYRRLNVVHDSQQKV